MGLSFLEWLIIYHIFGQVDVYNNTKKGGDLIMVHKLFYVASLVAFGAAVLGDTVFGHSGLELVSAGLFLYVGADLAEEVLSE